VEMDRGDAESLAGVTTCPDSRRSLVLLRLPAFVRAPRSSRRCSRAGECHVSPLLRTFVLPTSQCRSLFVQRDRFPCVASRVRGVPVTVERGVHRDTRTQVTTASASIKSRVPSSVQTGQPRVDATRIPRHRSGKTRPARRPRRREPRLHGSRTAGGQSFPAPSRTAASVGASTSATTPDGVIPRVGAQHQ
jgi:hypothetical protein